ncbi:MAG: MarR family transcriptional regulator [Pseudomonadota bacterium]
MKTLGTSARTVRCPPAPVSTDDTRIAAHDLERAIPYLLARAGARMGNAFSQVVKPQGLSLSEWRVCASLHHQPQQTLSQLVLHASVDMSTLSRIVDRLEKQGWVVRGRSEQDGRAVSLSLSESGRAKTRELIPMAQHYEATALADFSAAETELLRGFLLRLYTNAEALD